MITFPEFFALMRCVLCLAFLAFTVIANSEYYTSAVVEFIPVNYNTEVLASAKKELQSIWSQNVLPSTVNAVKFLNLKRYENFVINAKQYSVDIIVFPEDTTTGWPIGYDNGRDGALPWLEEVPPMNSVPYENADIQFTSPAVYSVSKYASQYNITIVIDIGEVFWCNQTNYSINDDDDKYLYSNCPSDGRWQFNTQLAFDNRGILIGKHRKLHLFEADTEIFNYPQESLDTFENFGVKFGMLVCFDIWFSYPGFQLASTLEIENFVLSSWWENNGTLPLVSAVNMQQAYARSTQSNLLACSVGLGFMNSGSGIYNGFSGEQNFNYDPHFLEKKDVLIIQQLPKSPKSTTYDNSINLFSKKIYLNTLDDILSSNSISYRLNRKNNQLISLPQNPSTKVFSNVPGSNVQLSLENNGVQCVFNATFAEHQLSSSEFVFMAYHGPYFDDLLIADLCSVYRCSSFNLNRGACETLTIDTDTSFDYLSITANFSPNRDVYTIGSRDQGQLLLPTSIELNRSNSTAEMIVNDDSPLLNIVLYSPSTTQNYY